MYIIVGMHFRSDMHLRLHLHPPLHLYVHLHLHMHLHLHLPTSALRLHLGLDLYRPTFTFGHTYSSIFKFETRSRSEAKLSYCNMWWEAGGNDAIRPGRAAVRC